MEREGRSTYWQLRRDVQVDFADLVRRASRGYGPRAIRMRVCERAVRLRYTGTTGVVVTLVCGYNEQCVLLGDAVAGEAIEEGRKGIVIGFELRPVVSFAGP